MEMLAGGKEGIIGGMSGSRECMFCSTATISALLILPFIFRTCSEMERN